MEEVDNFSRQVLLKFHDIYNDLEAKIICSAFSPISVLDEILDEKSPDLKIYLPHYQFNGVIIPDDYMIGNIGDEESELVIRACIAEDTFARLQNMKILHRNVKQSSRKSIISKLTSLAQFAGKKFHEIFVEYPKQQISKVLQLKQCESFFYYLQEALFNVDGEVGNEMKKFMSIETIEESLFNGPLPININITENKTIHNDKSITYNMNNNKIDNSSISTPITVSEAMDTT